MRLLLGLGTTCKLHYRISIAPIRFCLGYLSSNVYLAWEPLFAMAERHGRTIEPVPVLFAGLLGAYGQLGPAEVPPTALWMMRNDLRRAALLGLPLHRPAFHPLNPLPALRVSSLPMDAAAQQPDAKAALRRQTDDAIAAGVFGVPTMIVDGELFWGYDDFPFLERFLAGEDLLDAEALEGWSGPPRRSAMRKQQRDRERT